VISSFVGPFSRIPVYAATPVAAAWTFLAPFFSTIRVPAARVGPKLRSAMSARLLYLSVPTASRP
jgi:hypothetical protein